MDHPDDTPAQRLAAGAPPTDTPLSTLQQWMTGLIGHDRRIDDDAALSAAARVHFSGSDRLSPAEQIDIYRVQFWLRHTAVLIDHFEGLSRYLGQQRWQTIAESYLRSQESAVFALSDLGHHMADHIAALPAFADQTLCVDMARLEWAYQCAFSAFDDPPLSLEKLQSIPPDAWATARFTLADSVHLLDLRHQVADLRRELRAAPDTSQGAEPPDRKGWLTPADTKFVVYRRERVIYDKVVSNAAFQLLVEFRAGTPLIAACEAVIARVPEAEGIFESQLMQWFSLWGRLGWIVDVTTDQNTSKG